jgi:hypothetical protein
VQDLVNSFTNAADAVGAPDVLHESRGKEEIDPGGVDLDAYYNNQAADLEEANQEFGMPFFRAFDDFVVRRYKKLWREHLYRDQINLQGKRIDAETRLPIRLTYDENAAIAARVKEEFAHLSEGAGNEYYFPVEPVFLPKLAEPDTSKPGYNPLLDTWPEPQRAPVYNLGLSPAPGDSAGVNASMLPSLLGPNPNAPPRPAGPQPMGLLGPTPGLPTGQGLLR